MPVFRLKTKIAYFCHIPKCGGTSVEDYLGNRFGKLSFLDRRWEGIPKKSRWSNTSPQHVDANSISRILDPSFIDVEFATIRDPSSRFMSAFWHARKTRTIPQWLDADGLLSRIENADDKFHRSTDNHFRHASEFLNAGTKTFKIEDGGHDLIKWLDRLAGENGSERELPVTNQAHEIPKRKPSTAMSRFSEKMFPTKAIRTEVDQKLANRIFDVYRQDFGRLGYASPNQNFVN